METEPLTPRRRGRPRGSIKDTKPAPVKSLDRAIDVLERVGAGGTSLSQLAADLDESPATLYRVLLTLEARQLVEFEEDGQIWHVGPGAFRLGSTFLRRTNLVDRARPILRRLMETTGETANLGVERDGRVLFLNQVETHAHIRAFFPPGTVSAMHASGIGKALLAAFDAARRDRILDAYPLERFTPRSLTERAALLEDLERCAARGYAVDDQERNEGMRCLAAAVHDAQGEAVAGVSVSGPVARLADTDLPRLTEAVRDAARQLTTAIGGVAPTG